MVLCLLSSGTGWAGAGFPAFLFQAWEVQHKRPSVFKVRCNGKKGFSGLMVLKPAACGEGTSVTPLRRKERAAGAEGRLSGFSV